jgi:hypothetical protein
MSTLWMVLWLVLPIIPVALFMLAFRMVILGLLDGLSDLPFLRHTHASAVERQLFWLQLRWIVGLLIATGASVLLVMNTGVYDGGADQGILVWSLIVAVALNVALIAPTRWLLRQLDDRSRSNIGHPPMLAL